MREDAVAAEDYQGLRGLSRCRYSDRGDFRGYGGEEGGAARAGRNMQGGRDIGHEHFVAIGDGAGGGDEAARVCHRDAFFQPCAADEAGGGDPRAADERCGV